MPVPPRDGALHTMITSTAAHRVLFLVRANLGRDKTPEIIYDPILHPNASPPSTSAGEEDQEEHLGGMFPPCSHSFPAPGRKELALQWGPCTEDSLQGTPDLASQADGCDPAGVPGQVDSTEHLVLTQQSQFGELKHRRDGGESRSHQISGGKAASPGCCCIPSIPEVLCRVSLQGPLLIHALFQLGRCWEPHHPQLGTEISAPLGEACLCQCQTGSVLKLEGRNWQEKVQDVVIPPGSTSTCMGNSPRSLLSPQPCPRRLKRNSSFHLSLISCQFNGM